MLKGRVMGLRREVVAARRERVRKADMVVWFVLRLGVLEAVDVFYLLRCNKVVW
jgi:hypothetical protein